MWAEKQNWAFPWEPWLEFEMLKAECRQTVWARDISSEREGASGTGLMEFLGL